MAPSNNLRVSTQDEALRPLLSTPTAHMATTALKVGGITCGACTSAVEAGFKGVDGVGNVSVSLVMERAVVTHEIPKRIHGREDCRDHSRPGFDAEVLATDLPSPMFTSNDYPYNEDEDGEEVAETAGTTITTLAVEGMTCGACTSAIEGGFMNVSGVKHFNISLVTERAVVEHDASLLTAEQIAEIIEGQEDLAQPSWTVLLQYQRRSGGAALGDEKRLQQPQFGCERA